MRQRLPLLALALCLATLPLFAKRRAVLAGAPGHCVTGVLAESAWPRLIIADETHIYWINAQDDALYRVAKAGGPAERLARFGLAFPLSLAVDDTHVYIGSQRFSESFVPLPSVIFSIPKSGGVVATLVSGVQLPFDLETDATHLYWADAGTLDVESGVILFPGRIERALKNGAGRETLADNLAAPFDLTLDGDALWFGETGLAAGDGNRVGLFVMQKSGGVVTAVDEQTAPVLLIPSGAALVVWGFNAQVENAIFVIRKDRGGVRTLVEDENLGGVRVLDGIAYYRIGENEEPQQLWSVPVVGGTPALLHEDMLDAPDFTVDACAITLGTANGALERLKR